MAEFPPAQHIDGYTATGNTISFTIDGYTGKSVAGLTLTDGGSYMTPTASVAFSGGSGSGAVATCSLELKSLDFGSTGATSLISTSQPNSVQISMSGNSNASPLYGLQSLSATGDHFYNINTPPTISVSGSNGTSTDAVISFDSASALHVASLTTPTPATGGGTYPADSDTPVEIVDSANPSVVLGTATITADGNGTMEGSTIYVTNWTTPESRGALLNRTLKLKTTVPSYLVTSFTSSTQFYFRIQNGGTPNISITNTSPFAGGNTTVGVATNNVKPVSFLLAQNQSLFTAGTSGSWQGSWTGNIYSTQPVEGQVATPVATISSGSSVCSWIGNGITYANAGNSFWMSRNFEYLSYGGQTYTDFETLELVVRTASAMPSNVISLTTGGRYPTNDLNLSVTNIYTDPNGNTLATSGNFAIGISANSLSSSGIAIKAVRMNQATASSRITVTEAGDGYAGLLTVSPVGLYANTNLDDALISNNFTQTLRLKSATINKNNGTYSAQPTITVSGGGIADSNVTKTFKYNVKSATITSGGLGYTTSPTVTITGSVASGGSNATATSVLSASSAISLPNLTETEANPTTGDFRVICHALCEMIEEIDTDSVTTNLETSLQTSFTGVIERYVFTFDISPESGELVMDSEP
jgi:hypothetical protein